MSKIAADLAKQLAHLHAFGIPEDEHQLFLGNVDDLCPLESFCQHQQAPVDASVSHGRSPVSRRAMHALCHFFHLKGAHVAHLLHVQQRLDQLLALLELNFRSLGFHCRLCLLLFQRLASQLLCHQLTSARFQAWVLRSQLVC